MISLQETRRTAGDRDSFVKEIPIIQLVWLRGSQTHHVTVLDNAIDIAKSFLCTSKTYNILANHNCQ